MCEANYGSADSPSDSHYRQPPRTINDRFELLATAPAQMSEANMPASRTDSHYQRPLRTVADPFAGLTTVSHFWRPSTGAVKNH